MWIESIVLGILVGFFRGGRLFNFEVLKLKLQNFFIVGLLIQVLPFFLGRIQIFKEYSKYISFTGLLLVFIALLLNIKIKGFIYLVSATFVNLCVLLINDFRMPIYLANSSAKFMQTKLAVTTGQISNYVAFSNVDNYSKYLGKIIQMPEWYPLAPSLSIVDIVLGLGIIVFIQAEMRTSKGFFW